MKSTSRFDHLDGHSLSRPRSVLWKYYPTLIKRLSSWIKLYFRHLPGFSISPALLQPQPLILNVEITTRCQAACIICPHQDMARQDMDLSVDEIMGIVDQASAIGIESVHPHLFGEPTNHPFYSDVLYSIRQRHPRLSIIQYTNGHTLHKEDILSAILDNVDSLVISIDGATNSTMVEARPGIDPDKIRFGVKRLYSARSQSKPLITIRMTEMPLNSHEIHLYKTMWQPFCDHIQIAYLQNFRGSKLYNCKVRSALPCDRIFHSIVVTANQNVVLCCDDFKEDMVLGNLRDMPLHDIWFGARAKSIRRLHLFGNSNQIPMCGDCTYLGFL